MPWSFTPFTRKMVTGILFLRMLFKKTSWTLWDFSLAIIISVHCSWGPGLGPDDPAKAAHRGWFLGLTARITSNIIPDQCKQAPAGGRIGRKCLAKRT